MVRILFETKKETKEQAQPITKGLKFADYISVFAKMFGTDVKLVGRALGKDVTKLTSQIKTASRNVIKTSDAATLKKFGDQIPENIKNLSKELAIKRLSEASQQGNKALSKIEVQKIIDATKAEVKLIFSNEQKALASATTKQGGKQGVKQASSGISGWFNKRFSSGKPNPKVNVNTNKVGEWLGKRWKNFSTARKVVYITSALAIGYVGYTVYDYIQAFLGINPLPDLDNQDAPQSVKDWKKCIVDEFEGKNDATADVDDNGFYLQVSVNEFAGKQTGGWIRFYSDYKVTTQSGEIGKWDCNQEVIKSINEQDDTVAEMDNDVENMIDLLDFPVSGSDLQSANDILKKYLNNGRGQQFLSLYQRSGLGKGDLRKTLKYIVTTKASFTRLKDEMLATISKIQQGGQVKDTEGTKSDKESDGSSNTSRLKVIWDDGKVSGDSSGGIKYSPCNDFPMSLGCISNKIKDIQRCLNPTASLKVDGYFGPNTLEAMRTNSLFSGSGDDKTITKEIYDMIMKDCKKEGSSTDTGSREKVEPINVKQRGVELIPLTTLNTDEMKKKFGEDLLKQANKTINGEKVIEIIREKVRFTIGGRYILNMDEELTEDQLRSINQWMAGLGYALDKKRETLNRSRYVWVAKDRDSKRIARLQNKIDKIKETDEE